MDIENRSTPAEMTGEAPMEAARREEMLVTPAQLAARHSFSLLFHGPREALLPQAMDRFDNETIGSLEFMIVPLGPDEHNQRYEAIFN